MHRWSEAEFLLVSRGTRFSERTLAACKDVLVGGEAGADVALKYKMFHSQISRSLGILQERQESMKESVLSLEKESGVLRLTALQIAKNIMGDGFSIKDAEPSQTYEGPVIVNSNGFVVQRVGRSGVLHDANMLDKPAQSGAVLLISYPLFRDQKASVNEVGRDAAFGRRREDIGR